MSPHAPLRPWAAPSSGGAVEKRRVETGGEGAGTIRQREVSLHAGLLPCQTYKIDRKYIASRAATSCHHHGGECRATLGYGDIQGIGIFKAAIGTATWPG